MNTGEMIHQLSSEPEQARASSKLVMAHSRILVSFPGPAQLFVACSTEKRGEPGIFSHVSMT